MKQVKILILTALLLFPFFAAKAQSKASVQGYVMESLSKSPIAYATVRVVDEGGMLVSGASTNAEGRFEMNL
ncbi:MAG: carboxypeptidase regulatory-like domain-containing protein [Bacteroidales bacterium]|nr:carboxypeptidase regulatory-like domain-containing protein [Bacteroidales bacterium]